MGDHQGGGPGGDAELMVNEELALGGVGDVVLFQDLAGGIIDDVAGTLPDGGAGQQVLLALLNGDGLAGGTLAGGGADEGAVGVEVGIGPVGQGKVGDLVAEDAHPLHVEALVGHLVDAPVHGEAHAEVVLHGGHQRILPDTVAVGVAQDLPQPQFCGGGVPARQHGVQAAHGVKVHGILVHGVAGDAHAVFRHLPELAVAEVAGLAQLVQGDGEGVGDAQGRDDLLIEHIVGLGAAVVVHEADHGIHGNFAAVVEVAVGGDAFPLRGLRGVEADALGLVGIDQAQGAVAPLGTLHGGQGLTRQDGIGVEDGVLVRLGLTHGVRVDQTGQQAHRQGQDQKGG